MDRIWQVVVHVRQTSVNVIVKTTTADYDHAYAEAERNAKTAVATWNRINPDTLSAAAICLSFDAYNVASLVI